MLFSWSRTPCAQCGASVERTAAASHTCDPVRRVDFQVLAMGSAIAAFDTDLREFLTGNEGRFETWLAAREVRRSA
jgi:hypothetical protein